MVGLLGSRRPAPQLQREFADDQQTGEDTLHGATGPAGEPPASQPPAGGGAAGPGGGVMPAGYNEFGEMDGRIETGVAVHAFTNGGQTGTAKWLHTGGTGGTGGTAGVSTIVAPVYVTAPPAAAGAPATASVRAGTGTVQVTRSWIGVTVGDNGTAVWGGSGGGRVYIAATGAARIGAHEAGHVQETKKIHDAKITPMEARTKDQKTAPTEAAAESALKTHVNWNATLTSFATDDIAMNGTGGTFDTTDQAKADFYHDKGPKTVAGVNYQHYIEAP